MKLKSRWFFSSMEDEDASRSTCAAQGFVNGNETNYNYSDDDVVHSVGRLHYLLQVCKIFLISVGKRTIVLVISLFSRTRLPDASESRSCFQYLNLALRCLLFSPLLRKILPSLQLNCFCRLLLLCCPPLPLF